MTSLHLIEKDRWKKIGYKQYMTFSMGIKYDCSGTEGELSRITIFSRLLLMRISLLDSYRRGFDEKWVIFGEKL